MLLGYDASCPSKGREGRGGSGGGRWVLTMPRLKQKQYTKHYALFVPITEVASSTKPELKSKQPDTGIPLLLAL